MQGHEPLIAAGGVGLAGAAFFSGLYLGLTHGPNAEAASMTGFAAVVMGFFAVAMFTGIPVAERAQRKARAEHEAWKASRPAHLRGFLDGEPGPDARQIPGADRG